MFLQKECFVAQEKTDTAEDKGVEKPKRRRKVKQCIKPIENCVLAALSKWRRQPCFYWHLQEEMGNCTQCACQWSSRPLPCSSEFTWSFVHCTEEEHHRCFGHIRTQARMCSRSSGTSPWPLRRQALHHWVGRIGAPRYVSSGIPGNNVLARILWMAAHKYESGTAFLTFCDWF